MKRLDEPEFLKGELKNITYVAGTKKIGWLDKLNRALTENKGKVTPYKFLRARDLHDAFKDTKFSTKEQSEFHKLVSDPVQGDFWVSSMLMLWLWSINRVVYRLPVELFAAANQNYDVGNVPIETLTRMPQWTTCIAMDWEGIAIDKDGHCQRGLFYSLQMLNGKEYLQIELYVTFHRSESGTVKFGSYTLLIDTSKTNVREGMEQALIDIPKYQNMGMSSSVRIGLDESEDMLSDIITAISLVNGEHRKSELGKTDIKWPGYQIQGTSGYKIRPRLKAVEFMVGEEYVPQLRAAGISNERSQRKSHIRCGHWHTYWLGPRSGPRTQERYWLMPIVVSGKAPE
ncbi:putative protein FinQ [Erwinia phage vB_EamM_Special G]|uniref:Uncharacterized protein n=1 Tax=Erwinia phage vB_EamM_Special G TaxID=1815989 RepID=A0A191ZCC5_9CAUD|nr:putative protein FinQ [Erwinia phage vB_EamM_Special G]ANJ65042.1 putative protein FinQ [Erwinia phage vB_EamM_Special G]